MGSDKVLLGPVAHSPLREISISCIEIGAFLSTKTKEPPQIAVYVCCLCIFCVVRSGVLRLTGSQNLEKRLS